MNAKLVARMAWRDVRSGEMGLLLVALLVAVGTVTSISLFVDRLQSALLQESSNFLAADRQIKAARRFPTTLSHRPDSEFGNCRDSCVPFHDFCRRLESAGKR